MPKILYVEDEADLREDLVEILEEEGYDVATASNGKEGLSELLRFLPDLILSDCMMPVMNGIEMLTEIRQRHPQFSSTPIVFLSAHAQKAHVEEGISTGAQHYLTKPVDHDTLLALLRDTLSAQETQTGRTNDNPAAECRLTGSE